MMQMSKYAEVALINAGSNRQGTKVKTDDLTLTELGVKGLIGSDEGLTRKGSIARERLMSEALDKAFG